MGGRRVGWRVVAAGAVFLGSLAVLAASSTLALSRTGEDLAAQEQLRSAAGELAAAGADLLTESSAERGALLPEPANRRLAAAAGRVLAAYPGVEGGFYLAGSDQFAGTVGPDPGPAGPHGPAAGRRDPPPRETPYIRRMAHDALTTPAGGPPLSVVRDVGPSRVAVTAAPVGDDRPARAAVWVMIRLTGPAEQRERLARLQLATGLSLGGILLALGLVVFIRREERRRDALRDELRKAEHLAGLGRLLAGVAHEVRTPLTAIRSTVQLWERLPDHARTPESLAAVLGAVDRLNDLVGRLLLFARSGHEDRRPVDLNAVAAETAELLRAQADVQRVEVACDPAKDLPPVAGAAQALRQLVLNLAANALQATPAGGRLTIRTRGLPGRRVELAVSDTGPGVPAGLRDRVFEPFFTTRPDGTGLGLALCREVARQHGGDVTLGPPAGGGATFRLTLPADGETTP